MNLPLNPRKRTWFFLGFLFFFFILRFFFGLYCPPVTDAGDYVQTYVIGLKSYTTHTWPYFGPDVQQPETHFKTQMPGALEGLLISLSFWLWPSAESPTLFLNLLSFLALTLWGWYCAKRLPGFPPLFILAWLYIAPWTTHYSATVINPSYAFLGSALFFLGFCETLPGFSLGVIKPHWANLAMGFGIAWAMQLHMSYLAFFPFFLLSLYFQFQRKKLVQAVGYSFLGALPLLALILPTYWQYGFNAGKDVNGFVTGLNWNNVKDVLGTLARYCSIASFEMPRFIGDHTHEREMYLWTSPWLLVPGTFLWMSGYLQPLVMTGFAWVKNHPRIDWPWVKGLGIGTFLLVYGLFLFSPDMTASFRLVLLFPILFLYSFYCFDALMANRWWKWIGIAFIVFGVFFQTCYALKCMGGDTSIYSQYRDRMTQALRQNDYRIFSERRTGSLY